MSTNNYNVDSKEQYHRTIGSVDLYPAALRAIEEDDLDRMDTLIKLENFNKDSLGSLLYKACERSKDISIEENVIKNSANISNFEEGQSMLSICQTSRKNNEKLLDLLVQAEFQAEQPISDFKPTREHLGTPTKPMLKSTEKTQEFTSTPELPKFKSKVHRELKY